MVLQQLYSKIYSLVVVIYFTVELEMLLLLDINYFVGIFGVGNVKR